MAENKNLRINERIRIREVRVIDENGEQLGIMPTIEALERARDMGMDLVEVSPRANPPVCKIIDYGKYKFQMEKKLRDSKKNQKKQELRAIRMWPKIGDHDLDFKMRKIEKFLKDGDKVKVVVRYKGRQLAHTELGKDLLQKLLGRLSPEIDYTVDKAPAMEGRNMTMIIVPKSKK